MTGKELMLELNARITHCLSVADGCAQGDVDEARDERDRLSDAIAGLIDAALEQPYIRLGIHAARCEDEMKR